MEAGGGGGGGAGWREGKGVWLHGGLNDFLAVQRDVKDRPTRDGAVSKLMSYTFHTVKEKEGRRRRRRDAEETKRREGPDDDRDRGMRGGRGWQGRSTGETAERRDSEVGKKREEEEERRRSKRRRASRTGTEKKRERKAAARIKSDKKNDLSLASHLSLPRQ